MAEAKNTFLRSKMNRDLDDRLIPSGEYRTGLNIAVNKSEGEDVGALENVLGNIKKASLFKSFTLTVDGSVTFSSGVTSFNYISDTGRNSSIGEWDYRLAVGYAASINNVFNTTVVGLSNEGTSGTTLSISGDYTSELSDQSVITITPNMEIIGVLPNEKTSRVYIFATNYTDTSADLISDFCAIDGLNSGVSAILEYDTFTPTSIPIVLVQGAWLNFSKNSPIINSNLLENLLFWTDDRNQPRKINVKTAIQNTFTSNLQYSQGTWGYYKNEDHVSVAKYAPVIPIQLWKEYDDALHLSGPSYETTMRDVVSRNLPNGSVAFCNANGATFPTDTFSLKSIDGYVNVGNIVTTTAASPSNIPAGTTVLEFDNSGSGGLDAPTVKLSNNVTLSDLDELIFSPNPYYIPDYAGDPDYLEDKFVRFSYRFKFDDGEYSLSAPFTQAAFIPKQDGFFLGYPPTTANGDADDVEAYQSTIVKFMENKVNNILIRIPMPFKIDGDPSLSNPEDNFMQCDEVANDLKVTQIQILYKESEDLRLQVLDTIEIKDVTAEGSEKYFEYNYEARKPFRTLPEKDLIRVFDKIPPRAKTQEVISNRIVYGNFVDKLTPPDALDYNIALSDKFPLTTNNIIAGRTSIVEYPQHTVKHNRNYQVALVLSDRYGRSSSPILSNVNDSTVEGNINFGGSTFYAPYRNNATNETDTLDWPGDSIKILFNDQINSFRSNLTEFGGTGTPGIQSYNQFDSSKMNPGGWFMYKVVVKQLEQDYYNVYLPGIINGYPSNDQNFLTTTPPGQLGVYFSDNEIGVTGFTTLYSDNVNKVPRDLSEVGPEQKQYRSSVRLYGRVTNTNIFLNTSTNPPFIESLPPYNKQYYPGRLADSVDAIGQTDEMLSLTLQNIFEPRGLPGQYYNSQPGTSEGDVLRGGTLTNPANASIYQYDSDPYIARLSTRKPIGEQDFRSGTLERPVFGNNLFPSLAVYETDPVVSNLEIFWETSTWGWLSQLNEDILVSGNSPGGITEFEYLHFENQDPAGTGGVYGSANSRLVTNEWGVTNQAGGFDSTGIIVPGSFSVFDQASPQNDRTSEFEIIAAPSGNIGRYQIAINDSFCYLTDANIIENYTFSFKVATTATPDDQTLINQTGRLSNNAPFFTNCPNEIQLLETQTDIVTLTAENGSFDTSRDTEQLIFSFSNGTQQFTTDGVTFGVNADTGLVSVISGSPQAAYSLNLVVKDANAYAPAGSGGTNFRFLEASCQFVVGYGGNSVYLGLLTEGDGGCFCNVDPAQDPCTPSRDPVDTGTNLDSLSFDGDETTWVIAKYPDAIGGFVGAGTSGGTGYSLGTNLTTSPASGGSGFTFNITEIDNGVTGGPGVITNIEMVNPGTQYTTANTLLDVENVVGGGTGATVLRVCDNSNFGSSQFNPESEVYPFDCVGSGGFPDVKFSTFQRVLQPTVLGANATLTFSAQSGSPGQLTVVPAGTSVNVPVNMVNNIGKEVSCLYWGNQQCQAGVSIPYGTTITNASSIGAFTCTFSNDVTIGFNPGTPLYINGGCNDGDVLLTGQNPVSLPENQSLMLSFYIRVPKIKAADNYWTGAKVYYRPLNADGTSSTNPNTWTLATDAAGKPAIIQGTYDAQYSTDFTTNPALLSNGSYDSTTTFNFSTLSPIGSDNLPLKPVNILNGSNSTSGEVGNILQYIKVNQPGDYKIVNTRPDRADASTGVAAACGYQAWLDAGGASSNCVACGGSDYYFEQSTGRWNISLTIEDGEYFSQNLIGVCGRCVNPQGDTPGTPSPTAFLHTIVETTETASAPLTACSTYVNPSDATNNPTDNYTSSLLNQQVWISSWLPDYAVRFFTDPDLTTPYIPPNGAGWVLFKPTPVENNSPFNFREGSAANFGSNSDELGYRGNWYRSATESASPAIEEAVYGTRYLDRGGNGLFKCQIDATGQVTSPPLVVTINNTTI